MKKLILALIFIVGFLSTNLSAQSNMEDDKVYVTLDSFEDFHTYTMNFMMPGFEDQLELDLQYVDKIKTKWEARSIVDELNVSLNNMTITANIVKGISDEEVLQVLKMLNPNIKTIVIQ